MSLLCYLVITCLRILNHGYYVMLNVFSQFLEVMIPFLNKCLFLQMFDFVDYHFRMF